jgi:hypothetical protein
VALVKGLTVGVVKATSWGVPTQGSNPRRDTIYIVGYSSTVFFQKKKETEVTLDNSEDFVLVSTISPHT